MKDQIYVFGHMNPDCDSICSSIAYAHLKNKLSDEEHVACRLGDASKEAEFALNRFNHKVPQLITDIRPQISDLKSCSTTHVDEMSSIQRTMVKMHEKNLSLLPVVDSDKRLKGVITLYDIAKQYFQLSDRTIVRNYTAPFQNLVDALDAELVSGRYPHEDIKGSIYLDSELEPGQRLGKDDIVIVGNSNGSSERAVGSGAGCIICTKKSDIPKNTDAAVLRVDYSIFKAIKLVNRCVSICNIMGTEYVHFREEDYLEDIEPIIKESYQRFFPVIDKENKLLGVLSSKDLIEADRKRVILVDHNEASQSAKGIGSAKVEEVIDHHKIAEFETKEPIKFYTRPVGCTATIIAQRFESKGIDIEKDIAGLLVSAIISDTLLFKSPTSTYEDKQAAEKLAGIAGINLEEYGMELLRAGASIDDKTAEQIFHADMKVFAAGDSRIAVGQVNSVDNSIVLARKREIMDVMEDYRTKNSIQTANLMITDILQSKTDLLIVGEKEIVSKAFGKEPSDDIIELPGVVSRKKQVMPKLVEAS